VRRIINLMKKKVNFVSKIIDFSLENGLNVGIMLFHGYHDVFFFLFFFWESCFSIFNIRTLNSIRVKDVKIVNFVSD
jgi:hypothetical protein